MHAISRLLNVSLSGLPWKELWPVLLTRGWRIESVPSGDNREQKYYMPPGVYRGGSHKNRRDYFDSLPQVYRHVEKTLDVKALPPLPPAPALEPGPLTTLLEACDTRALNGLEISAVLAAANELKVASGDSFDLNFIWPKTHLASNIWSNEF